MDQGGAIRRQLCLLGAGPGSPSGATPSNVFELFCRTKPPTDESQRGGPPAPVLGPLNTSSGEECKLASTLVLLWVRIFYSPNCKPTPSSSLPKGDPVFRAAACCDPLCLARQFKFFFFPLLQPKLHLHGRQRLSFGSILRIIEMDMSLALGFLSPRNIPSAVARAQGLPLACLSYPEFIS